MNGNFDDDEAIQNEKERNKSGILQGVDHFSSTQERGIYGEKEKTPSLTKAPASLNAFIQRQKSTQRKNISSTFLKTTPSGVLTPLTEAMYF